MSVFISIQPNTTHTSFTYREEEPHQIAVDHLAAMTDEYFLAAHKFMCPGSRHHVEFRSYFNGVEYRPA